MPVVAAARFDGTVSPTVASLTCTGAFVSPRPAHTRCWVDERAGAAGVVPGEDVDTLPGAALPAAAGPHSPSAGDAASGLARDRGGHG